jgi:hypothetical protein
MPPKRKIASAFTDGSPTKRRTRSSGGLVLDTSLSRASITPKKPLRTYGRTPSRTSPITKNFAEPRNQREDADEDNRDESSEDELNLSPLRSHKQNSSSVVEVTILTKRRAVNSNVTEKPASTVAKLDLLTGKAYRSSRTTNLNNHNHVDQSEQDDDSDGRPLSPLTNTPNILPSTKIFALSRNLRKRRQGSEDGELSSPPSPKKLKLPTTTTRISEPSSKTRRALPPHITDQKSPSPAPTRFTSPPASPPNDVITLPASSPSKKRTSCKQTHLPQEIPTRLYPCLNAQKRAILRALHHNAPKTLYGEEDEESEGDETATNETAFQQLTDVLTGTVTRGEGNSCLLLGPRGSGKTSVRESAL